MLPSASDKAKLFPKNVSKHSNLDAFPSRTNLKLYNITSKLVKKVTTNHDFSKASGPDCILVVVLTKWKPEPLHILNSSICA